MNSVCLYEVAHRLAHFSVAVLVAPQLIDRGNYGGIVIQGFTLRNVANGIYIVQSHVNMTLFDGLFEELYNEVESTDTLNLH